MVECDWVVAKVWLFQTCNFTFCKFGAKWKWAGSSVFEAEWNKRYGKVKVVTVHTVCSSGEPVDWFLSAVLSYWDLDRVWSNYRFKEEMEMRTSSMWPWLARMDNEVGHTRLSCQEEVPLLNLNFILSCCNTIHWYCCVWFTASSSWKEVAASSTMGLTSLGTRMRTLKKAAQWRDPGLSSSINEAVQVKG